MNKTKILWVAVLISVMTFSSCSKDEQPTTKAPEVKAPVVNTVPEVNNTQKKVIIPEEEGKVNTNQNERKWRKAPREKIIDNAWANNDYTCYKFTESVWSCSYTEDNCSPWIEWKRTCNWTQTTSYVQSSSYACSTPWQSASKASVSAACSIEETDNTAPEVEWWIK